MSNSEEEEIARDFICFEKYNAVIVVCDATCLERNLNLVLQILSLTPHVILCINLIDEAEKKGIVVDIEKLKQQIGVPVVKICARDKIGFDELLEKLELLIKEENKLLNNMVKTLYF